MIREDFRTGLGQIMCIEEDQDTDKIIEAGQDIILIIEVVMGKTQEVITGMGGLIIIMVQEEVIEVKITIAIVDHMRDRPEMEEIAEVQAIVDQYLVQGQAQIVIGVDALSVGNTITLQGNVQLGKQVGKQNKYSKCSIWMKTR